MGLGAEVDTAVDAAVGGVAGFSGERAAGFFVVVSAALESGPAGSSSGEGTGGVPGTSLEPRPYCASKMMLLTKALTGSDWLTNAFFRASGLRERISTCKTQKCEQPAFTSDYFQGGAYSRGNLAHLSP